MPDSSPGLRRAARRLLAAEAGGEERSAEHLAAASGRLLDRLSERLAEVIGPAGVQALVLRALKLHTREFPFLDERIVPQDQGDSPDERLRACLHQQEPHVITNVSTALFATVMGLLVTIIGERLAGSLLREVWPEIASDAELQETEE